jgi:hypothetical protein
MFNSFEQAIDFIISNGIWSEFKSRIQGIHLETLQQKWKNEPQFSSILERLE